MNEQQPRSVILTVDGAPQTFIPVRQFRETYQLPSDFGVATFEEKHFDGLASMDGSAAELKQLRQRVLDAIPQTLTIATVQPALDALKAHFRYQLETINPAINLKPAELDFAVAGFGDANQAFFYEIIRHRDNPAAIDVLAFYRRWVMQSTYLSVTVHEYSHHGGVWGVQIVNTVYGRVGLKVVTKEETPIFIVDTTYACPAQSYMTTLNRDVLQTVIARLAD